MSGTIVVADTSGLLNMLEVDAARMAVSERIDYGAKFVIVDSAFHMTT